MMLFLSKIVVMRYAVILFVFLPLLSFGQNKDFDKLEMLYDQGHYKKVLKQANKLILKVEYTNSVLPSYYKSLSMLQLFRNEKWRRRNPKAIEDATKLFLELKKRDVNGKIFAAHSFEIQALKRDYDYFLEDLQRDAKKNVKLIETVKTNYTKLFSGVQDIQDADPVSTPPILTEISDVRKKIVEFSYKYVGVKYRAGGTDSNGFDCSGFVTFVFTNFKINIPRISRDQQQKSSPLRIADVQPGDLVFFANGSSVNHVGIVVKNRNGIVSMIHSSTSQGIVVTEINTSNYWKARVHSYGTFLK